MNTIICSQTTPTNATTYPLKDHRESPNKSYLISKIGSHCWMVQNLALYGNQTINHVYSNLELNKTYFLPASTAAMTNSTGYWNNGTDNNAIEQMHNGTHTDATYDSSYPPYNFGSYYTFQVATASTGAAITSLNHNTIYDICPAGWHLPSFNGRVDGSDDGSNSEFNDLANGMMYQSNTWMSVNMTTAPSAGLTYFRLSYSGGCYNGLECPAYYDMVKNSREVGHNWGSTVVDETSAYVLYHSKWGDGDENIFRSGAIARGHGMAIRCVVK